MSNNDALNKIENIVNNAISSQLKTIKDQADENETKINLPLRNSILCLALLIWRFNISKKDLIA